MAQRPAQFCTECGAPMQAGQRFCSNCGATMAVETSGPTVAASNTPPANNSGVDRPAQIAPFTPGIPDPGQPAPPRPPNTGPDPYTPSSQGITPPPPPPSIPVFNPYTSSAPEAPTYPGYPTPNTPNALNAPGAYSAVPAYAQKPKQSRGCLISSIVLLIVLAAGIGGFVFVRTRNSNGNSTNSTSGSNATTTTGNGSTGGSTPTTNSTSTSGSNVSSSEQLNLKITYASIALTISSVQLASSFSDDNSSNGAGVVRLNLHEVNTTTGNPRYLESDVLLLVLPDGNTVQSSNQQQFESPDGGVSRDNWVDFALNSQVTLSQLTLRIGTANQNQMSIPLQPNADISKYQDKTSSPNAKFQYNGIDWTLKIATLSYSYSDAQATAGNRYVIITLSVVNNSPNDYRAFPPDFMRMQAGSSTQAPDNYTFSSDVVARGGTADGVFGFLVPQDATSFTLIMLGQPNASPSVSQVTQTFQIQ